MRKELEKKRAEGEKLAEEHRLTILKGVGIDKVLHKHLYLISISLNISLIPNCFRLKSRSVSATTSKSWKMKRQL